jgi:DNA-binding transcriptional MerR regulator/methylmalonyl-CoA mutase cobalamin-binding subunit
MTKSREDERPSPPVPEGRYRIATVAELTGVPEPTLRAWERRYGIPSPERTEAGYRLYGEEDIATVREMLQLCEQGLAAAEAAKLLLSRRGPRDASARAADDVAQRDPLELAVDAIVDAVRKFDDVALERSVRRAMFMGHVLDVVDGVFLPALRTVGDLWHAGELSIAQEHLVSQRVGTVLRDLLRLGTDARSPHVAVLGAFADEEHDLGLLAVAVRLAQAGMRPLVLGARTPPSAIRAAVEASSPALVALSTTVPPERARARELVDDYAAAVDGVSWVVGGVGAPAVAEFVEKRGGLVLEGAGVELEAGLRSVVRPALRTNKGRGPSRAAPVSR